MRFHGTAKAALRAVGAAMRGTGLTSAAVAILLTGCTKQHPQNRYDWAIELAKTYSIGEPPKDFTAVLGQPIDKHRYRFLDLIWGESFSGKFQAAAEQLAKQSYFQDGNPFLLQTIISDNKLNCAIDAASLGDNVDCGTEGEAYKADPLRVLHTDAGDFIFSSADQSRGNGHDSNENASPLVIVVDPSDGGLGLVLEDHIATSGGRPDVLSAALTLASSIVRLGNANSGSSKLQLTAILYDLEAAKTHTLFTKPAEAPETGPVSQPATNTQSNTGSPPPQITKEQFKALVLGKSMAEIRSMLGTPSNIEEDSDGVAWFYWSNDLPVEDPDSGRPVNSSVIRFEPLTKIAVEVHF